MYPYDYMNNVERFHETELPPHEKFHNTLADKDITKKQYHHAQQVWAAFNCKTLKDYHDIYLTSVIRHLADVFVIHVSITVGWMQLTTISLLALHGMQQDLSFS